MQGAFVTVVWIVGAVGVIGAIAAMLLSRRTWEEYGANHLLLDSEGPRTPRSSVAVADAERDEEVRQMLEARNARRRRRGEPELDIEAEIARLSAPAIDDELRQEIRDLVVARNHRRARRGQPQLDVEAEVQREIAQLGTR